MSQSTYSLAPKIKIKTTIYIDRLDGNGYQSSPYSDNLSMPSMNWGLGYKAANFTITLFDEDNKFIVGGSHELKRGHNIRVSDTAISHTTTITEDTIYKFDGFIHSITYDKNSKTLTLSCLDKLHRLSGMSIIQRYEGTKTTVRPDFGVKMKPSKGQSFENDRCRFFDFVDENGIRVKNIANRPAIDFYVRSTEGFVMANPPEYEIDYANGQLQFRSGIHTYDVDEGLAGEFEVYMKFDYFVDGLYIEDLIKNVCLLEDYNGNAVFEEADFQDTYDIGTLEILYELMENETYRIDDYVGAEDPPPEYTEYTRDDYKIYFLPFNNILEQMKKDYFKFEGGAVPAENYISVNEIVVNAKKINDNLLYVSPSATTPTWTDFPTEEGMEVIITQLGTTPLDISGTVYKHSRDNYMIIRTDETLDSAFDDVSGLEITVYSINRKYGYILLYERHSNVVYWETDNINSYIYNTLQSTGVEIPFIEFDTKNTSDRFAAIDNLLEYLPLNYIVRSNYDKVIGAYMKQKSWQNYTLANIKSLNYVEDKKIYTKVELNAPNPVPTNLVSPDIMMQDEDFFTYSLFEDVPLEIGRTMLLVPKQISSFADIKIVSFNGTFDIASSESDADYFIPSNNTVFFDGYWIKIEGRWSWPRPSTEYVLADMPIRLYAPTSFGGGTIGEVQSYPSLPVITIGAVSSDSVKGELTDDVSFLTSGEIRKGIVLPSNCDIAEDIEIYNSDDVQVEVVFGPSAEGKFKIEHNDTRIIWENNMLVFKDETISDEDYARVKNGFIRFQASKMFSFSETFFDILSQ